MLIITDINFSEEAREADPEENYLLLRASIKGRTVIVGSIYGPNDHNPGFFHRLKAAITKLGEWPTIIGGDWNCTFSSNPIATNIDCANMYDVPSSRHSVLLSEMCNELNLSDPYRLFFPGRRDYTFNPRNPTQINKSRIDFFLISIPFFSAVSSCDISQYLQNSLFDHKSINIHFNTRKTKGLCNPSVSREILADSELELVVRLAAIECYVIHTVDGALRAGEKNILLTSIGNCKNNFRHAGPAHNYLPASDLDAERLDEREILINQIRTFLNEIDFNRLENLERSCTPDIFMEVLLIAVKNDSISYQAFVKKVKTNFIKSLCMKLASAKASENQNLETIADLESKINLYYDAEMTREIEKYSLFEHINMEKMTPHFLKLAKCTKPDSLLCDINDNSGNAFGSDGDRREFIVKYYENLYRLPETQRNDLTGCIENFLGPDILASPLINSMKINRNLSDSLEGPFSLIELDKAVNEKKSRTAAGPDGIGNGFIKKLKFWWLFREPLLKYGNFCLERGELTQSFLTASIKLIPKRGTVL